MNLSYLLKMIFIGLVQGLTEPLPISSSAHMIICQKILNIDVLNINIEILINFSSCLAIGLFFYKKIYYLFKNTITNKKEVYPHLNRSFLLKLIIASIPIAITGFLFKDTIEIFFSSTLLIGIFLIITSLFLFRISCILKKKKHLNDHISYVDSIIIGLFQGLAIFPGISRSGTTFFSGVSRNIRLSSLFDFSFFLYLIASFGSLVLSFFSFDIISFVKEQNIFLLLIVFVITFISTLISINLFHKILSQKTTYFFFFYTFFLGLFLIITNLLLLIPIQF